MSEETSSLVGYFGLPEGRSLLDGTFCVCGRRQTPTLWNAHLEISILEHQRVVLLFKIVSSLRPGDASLVI